MKLLEFKHSINRLQTSIFSVVCYCLMNPEAVRFEELCLIFSMFCSVLEDQTRKLFAETYDYYNWFYSIERVIVLSSPRAFLPACNYINFTILSLLHCCL